MAYSGCDLGTLAQGIPDELGDLWVGITARVDEASQEGGTAALLAQHSETSELKAS
jgi:hypothetical protein